MSDVQWDARLSPSPRRADPPVAVQGLPRHNVKEFTRFKNFLPRIYEKFGGKMLI